MAAELLLGVADSVIPSEDDCNVTWLTNKFGGKAVWMEECMPDCNPRCDNCQKLLFNVTQIYCPLIGSEYHRTLNVFGCISTSCQKKSSSWKVLRSQCKEIPTNAETKLCVEKSDSFNDAAWCDGANDWGNDQDDIDTVSEMIEDLSMTQSTAEHSASGSLRTGQCISSYGTQQQEKLSNDVPYFTARYVHVVEEPTRDAVRCYKHEESLLKEYEKREGPLANLDLIEKCKEKYEKRKITDGDRVFHRFQKRIKLCPKQCLRYEWNGSPLNFSSKSQPSCEFSQVPVCSNCQSTRVFEMQLMPALSWTLKLPDSIGDKSVSNNHTGCNPLPNGQEQESLPDHQRNPPRSSEFKRNVTIGDFSHESSKGIEFGTLFVFTCSKSCNRNENGSLKPIEEFVILQSFPDNNQIEKAMKL